MLPRTIRLDPSDTFVYRNPAEPGEWAVTGTFLFAGVDTESLSGKALQAFRAGFLGIESFGWSTLAVVTIATEAERAAIIDRLAAQLVSRCGAPDLGRARPAAEEEVAFAQSLCEHEAGTLIGLHRRSDGDTIRESFRTLHRTANPLQPTHAFRFVEADPDEEQPEDGVDLATLARSRT